MSKINDRWAFGLIGAGIAVFVLLLATCAVLDQETEAVCREAQIPSRAASR